MMKPFFLKKVDLFVDITPYVIILYLMIIPFYLPIKYLYAKNSDIMFFASFFVILYGCISLAIKFFRFPHFFRLDIYDKYMAFFLLYSVLLAASSVYSGGGYYFLKHLYAYCFGVIFYFFSRVYINSPTKIDIITDILIAVSTVVSILFIAEWVKVNIYFKEPFQWIIEMNKVLGGYAIGVASKESTVRVYGLLGTYISTSLFVTLGAILSLYKFIFHQYVGKRSLYFISLLLCFGTVFLASSRTIILCLLLGLFFFITFISKKIPKIKRTLFVFGSITISFAVLISFWIGERLGKHFIFYYYQLFLGIKNRPPEYLIYLNRLKIESSALIENYQKFPWTFFTGTGFYIPNEKVINPVNVSGDLYISTLISMFGPLFVLFFLAISIFTFIKILKNFKLNKLNSLDEKETITNYYNSIIAFCAIIVVFLISTIHFPSINRYANYYWFFVVLGIIINLKQLISNTSRKNLNA